MNGFIYGIYRNNKIVYVGLTTKPIEQRFNEHIRCCKYSYCNNIVLYRAMQKYGIDKFVIKEIFQCDEDIDQLRQWEIFFIEWFGTYNNGYNLTRGGDGLFGFRHSKESREKMSKRAMGNKNAIGNKNGLNYKHTNIAKEKISKAMIGKRHNFRGGGNVYENKHTINFECSHNKKRIIKSFSIKKWGKMTAMFMALREKYKHRRLI